MVCREKVIIDLEPWIFLWPPICPAKVCEQVKAMLCLQKEACIDDRVPGHGDGYLAERICYIDDPVAVLFLELLDKSVKFFGHKIPPQRRGDAEIKTCALNTSLRLRVCGGKSSLRRLPSLVP